MTENKPTTSEIQAAYARGGIAQPAPAPKHFLSTSEAQAALLRGETDDDGEEEGYAELPSRPAPHQPRTRTSGGYAWKA